MKLFFAFALSCLSSLMLVPIVIRLARRIGMVNHPSDDRWHERSTPLMGGVAIFLGFMIGSLVVARDMTAQNFSILIGCAAMFLLGLLDDRFGTYPIMKALIQVGIAILLIPFGVRITILPGYLAIPLTVLWIVGVTNAINLIDNMDGISSGTSAIAGVAIAIMAWIRGETVVAIMAIAITGGCLGFLRYNFNPARIFMGDCGSLFLGFALAALSVAGFWQESSPIFQLLAAPALILGYPIFDTTFVTLTRIAGGGRPWIGGKDHSTHRLARMGLSVRKVALMIYALSIIGGGAAFAVLSSSLLVSSAIVSILLAGSIAFGIIIKRESGHSSGANCD